MPRPAPHVVHPDGVTDPGEVIVAAVVALLLVTDNGPLVRYWRSDTGDAIDIATIADCITRGEQQ